MARPPRGGFRPADVRGTLGSLLKSTLAQAGVVRDVIERGAREGRSRLDEVRANRRRQEALAELGEAVLELIRRGEIDLAELPEVRDIVADLDELDAHSGGARGGRRRERDADDDEPWGGDDERHAGGLADVTLPGSRHRFDDRGASDGTVSSSRWAPPSGPARKAETPRVWRPPATAAPEATPSSRTPTIPQLPKAIARAHQGGGIRFDDDDDLAEYMHPDDVPPKSSKPPHDES